jgi:hypothetical protein
MRGERGCTQNSANRNRFSRIHIFSLCGFQVFKCAGRFLRQRDGVAERGDSVERAARQGLSAGKVGKQAGLWASGVSGFNTVIFIYANSDFHFVGSCGLQAFDMVFGFCVTNPAE